MITSTKLGRAVGLTKKTINRLAKEGRIPSITLPSGHRRFDLEEVKAALASDLSSLLIVGPGESAGQSGGGK